MTSTFRVIFLASSIIQSAGREASRQVDLGPTFMILSLRVLLMLRHEDRRHLEYTSGVPGSSSRFPHPRYLFDGIETCRNLPPPRSCDSVAGVSRQGERASRTVPRRWV
jgi:hypothetical protein